MELLDPLRQVSILGIAGQNGCLIELLSAVLDSMDLHTDLNASLFQI
jgi:hypothetical protein